MEVHIHVFVLVLAFFRLSEGQRGGRIRGSLEECTDDDVIAQVGRCIAAKFDDIRPDSFSYEQDAFYTGRHPLATDTDVKDAAIRHHSVIPLIARKLKTSHKKLLNILYTAGKAAVEKEHQYLAIEKLKHVNLQEVIYEHIVGVLEHGLLPYFQQISHHQAYTGQNSGFMSDQCDPVCRFPSTSELCDLCQLLVATIPTITDVAGCLAEFSPADFEDNIRWMKCFYNCEDLIPMSSCLKDTFARCGEWSVIADVIIKGFAEFTELSYCKLNVVSERNITLYEGGNSSVVSFYSYMPPSAYCLDFTSLSAPLGMIRALGSLLGVIMGDTTECIVNVQVSLQNFWHDLLPHIDGPRDVIGVGRPKCHDSSALRQAVVGYHDYHNDTMNMCRIVLTEENWNQTFAVPIWASIDQKNDGNVSTDLTLKLVINNRDTVHSEKLPVLIVDTDVDASTLCQSSGDPHVTSFDGHYYNNMYEGYFYLYRNTLLPYQVQVIYQRCTPEANATCTCAVAVKSGDDVFVIDKCRRRGASSSDAIMRMVMFVNGDVTPGTRVFTQSYGADVRVMLPTGLTVDVVTSLDALSVYVNPSNYDLEQTDGLCGYFDGDSSNDLMMPDGTIYAGDGSNDRGQPRPFSRAWRVPENDTIFEGVVSEDDMTDMRQYCKCNHVLFRGVQCSCGPGEMVETCDTDLGGEITDNLTMLIKKSRKSYDTEYNIGVDDIDVDLTFDPPELSWKSDAIWTEATAEEYCRSLISANSTNSIIAECVTSQGEAFVEEAVWHCIEDIQIIDTEAWQYVAMESAKRKCVTHYRRGIDLGNEWVSYWSDTCLNDCSGNGVCSNGTCTCDSGWSGGDCSLIPGTPVTIMDESSLCDTRLEDCRYATIYGQYLPHADLSCDVISANRNSDGTFALSGGSQRRDVIYLSPYQVACDLPSAGSYQITLLNAGQPVVVTSYATPDVYATSFLFMVYDSACYECSLTSKECTELPGQDGVNHYCLIGSGCYANGQTNPDDDCLYCNSTDGDDSSWTWFTDDVCTAERNEYNDERERADRERTIRISVAVTLTVLIIVLTIIIYIRTNKNKTVELDKDDVTAVEGDSSYCKPNHGKVNEAYEMTYDGVNQSSAKSRDVTRSRSSDNLDPANHKPVPAQLQRVKDEELGHVTRAHDPATTAAAPTETGHSSRLSSVSSIGSASDLHHKARKAAAQKHRSQQQRTESMTSHTSIRSIGIGGAGPVQYTHYNKLTDDDTSLKGMGGHGSPSLPTRNNLHKGHHYSVAF